jgi:3-deoxy-manno-octulosonate cytidylyltransferase (CMP-KDO synthetase)
MSDVVVVIPARFASSRFPGKPLAARTGRALIQHVCDRAALAKCTSRVLVATDDSRIERVVREFGGEVVMTRADHANGTSRLAEVARDLAYGTVVVNVQGDEPEIEPALIDKVAEALGDADMCTIASPFAADEDPNDPNIVKVVVDRTGRALYFSRSPIPFKRDAMGPSPPLKHVGLYAYRREFLIEYVGMTPTPLERTEHLEQLRVLEHGRRIQVVIAETRHHGIDTPEQYNEFVRRWQARQQAG